MTTTPQGEAVREEFEAYYFGAERAEPFRDGDAYVDTVDQSYWMCWKAARAALAPPNAAIPSAEPVAELYVCASITGGRRYLTPEEWSRDWLYYGPEEWKVIRMVATEIVVEKSTGPDPWADYRAAPPGAGGMLRTTREYTCGCSAEGPGDVPNYCPAHSAVQSGDSGVREALVELIACDDLARRMAGIFATLNAPSTPDADYALYSDLSGDLARRKPLALAAARAAIAAPTTGANTALQLLAGCEEWISAVEHGDNCFVSNAYAGDPGNRCNCGKTSLLEAIAEAREAGLP